MKTSKHENVGSQFTLELCEMYHQLGFDCVWNDGKHLTLIEKDLSGLADPSRSKH